MHCRPHRCPSSVPRWPSIVGFKGNSAYGRLWEARKIWGGIVNSSRTWGVWVRDYVTDLHLSDGASHSDLVSVHKELIYRHVAWLSALRTQLRRRKPWEIQHERADNFRKHVQTANMSDDVLRSRMKGFVDDEELAWLLARKNPATQVLAKQSERLKELRSEHLIDDFRHVELGRLVETFYTLQDKCERIKNFPLPRQYASANWWFVLIFVTCVPLTLVPIFADPQNAFRTWLAVPVSTLLSWVFLIWNKVVDYSENPFEGLVNDIPIDSLSRTIEIDLREMLGEEDLPKPVPAIDHASF